MRTSPRRQWIRGHAKADPRCAATVTFAVEVFTTFAACTGGSARVAPVA